MESKDAACCHAVPWSLCLFVATVSCGKKAAEAMEKPLGIWTQVGPRNHVLGGGSDPTRRRAVLGASARPL